MTTEPTPYVSLRDEHKPVSYFRCSCGAWFSSPRALKVHVAWKQANHNEGRLR